MNFVSPYAVENVSIGVDPDVQVRLDDFVKLAVFLVSEKGVWHPDFFRICHRQVLDSSIHVVESQSIVIPLLSKRYLHTVLLQNYIHGSCSATDLLIAIW